MYCFRYTSHEVIIDDEQIKWFEELLKSKPADDGWRIFVFSHAPPNGSGIRIIQENHDVNGCCWLNHSDEKNCRKFNTFEPDLTLENATLGLASHLGVSIMGPSSLGPLSSLQLNCKTSLMLWM